MVIYKLRQIRKKKDLPKKNYQCFQVLALV